MSFVGTICMFAGAGLIYKGITDLDVSTANTLFAGTLGAALIALGAKLTFGLERNTLDFRTRRWRSEQGFIFRKAEEGPFDDLDLVILEPQERHHGTERYYMYRVAISRTDGEELFINLYQTHEEATADARLLSLKLDIGFQELSRDDGMSAEV